MEAMAMPLLQLPLTASPSSSSSSSSSSCYSIPKLPIFSKKLHHRYSCRPTKSRVVVLVGSNEEATELSVSSTQEEPDPQDLKYIRQIKRVLELLRKNRDMIFSEVKLTIMIEDPREVERRRLLGIEDADTPTREDLAAVLEEVNEGKVPKDRVALQMLAEEMIQWPNLEVEATKKKPGKSLYAKATDTGIDPKEAARRLNADWDSAAEIEDSDVSDDTEVPPALGYGALYLVTAFPVIIGISVFQMQLFLPQNTVEVDVHLTTEHPHHLDFPTSQGGAQEADEFYDEVEVDANMSPDHPYDFEKERLQKEKQISVDPISLQGSSMGKASFKLMLPPLPPAKGFLSCSLPNSANSSPRFNSAPLKKKSRDGSKANPRQVCNLARQHSAADDHVLTPLQRETYLRRSKSCYEGRARASADDFELWLTKPNSIEYDNKNDISFSKTEPNKDSHRTTRSMDGGDEEFKCGALCLFLPGFGKGKPVRAKKEVVDIEHVVNIENVISRRVSLEKFECGSWASSAITHDSEDDSKSLYFDLPLELIRTSVNDAHSPVTAAFFFDNDKKGVLKNGSARSTAKKSDESPRHVRFSLSSPRSHPTSPASCITPRLRKAREEFNAFLEAQGA